MGTYQITMCDRNGNEAGEGRERHSSFRAARHSAIRSAIAIILEELGSSDDLSITFQIRNEHTSQTQRFELKVQVDAVPHT